MKVENIQRKIVAGVRLIPLKYSMGGYLPQATAAGVKRAEAAGFK